MLGIFVMLGCVGCFICGLIAGIDIGSKETMKQLSKEIEF